MVRYLLLAGAPPSSLVDAVTKRLAKLGDEFVAVASSSRIALFTDTPSAVVEIASGGFLLGTMFAPDGARITRLSEAQQACVGIGGAAVLPELVWGSYLAVCVDVTGGDIDVMRDPSGALPCYFTSGPKITAFSSDADLLVQLGLASAAIDWTGIDAHLRRVGLRAAQTCLADVKELLASQVFRLGRSNEKPACVWSPWSFAGRERQFTRYEDAVVAVGQTVRSAVRALARETRRSVLGVSGGLDSSIVAACLSECEVDVTLATMVTQDPRGDERAYASVIATAIGRDLHACFESLDLVDLTISKAAHLPRPTARAFAQSTNALFQELADARHADAFFSGGGGDNVFCLMHNVLPVVDRYRVEGLSRGLAKTAIDVSMVAGVSVWEVFRRSLRRQMSSRHGYVWPETSSYLAPGAAGLGAVAHHPWLDAPPGTLPGKAAHIAWVMHVQNHIEGHGEARTLPTLWPLLSQPVIETCLRVPTWMWFQGGRNRSVARAAFTDILPQQIVTRRSKGTPDGFAAKIFETRRAQIRDMLSEGMLATHGMLDMNSIPVALGHERLHDTPEFNRIMTIVDVEAWLRAWSGRSQASADIKSLL
ncbi:asparagine synthase C-terminal domain-containing protein [Novosphingobium resinovorum]|uniref:asparagine synthase (glutamine-hydrolyzing) n=1 Tax=Novosphingobium resinovorum TaxID=158500 RepID=A0A1D8AFL2_9SPHN|nr:asparagine synthase C-terminal domain-containing protein [Novosphingobium resinovorum]AOR80895.1 hypothetical protein BES08_29330 [Novosphingobium resinovorum]